MACHLLSAVVTPTVRAAGKLYAKGMTDVEKNQNPDVTPPEPVDFSKNKYYDPDFKFYDDSLVWISLMVKAVPIS
jgi:hypothetical protein